MGNQFKRVISKLLLTKPDIAEACWIWRGATGSAGYGQMKIRQPDGTRKTKSVHTWLYERLLGPLKPGLEPDHVVCQNKRCCNPTHLEPVTHRENCQRRERTNSYKQSSSYRKATSEGARRMWALRKGLTAKVKSCVMSEMQGGLHNT